MARNDLAKRLSDQRKKELAVAQQWAEQATLDALIIVLGDPDVMGKDTFGAERAMKVGRAVMDMTEEIQQGLVGRDDADAIREQVDRKLRERLGDNAVPWSARYIGWEDDSIDEEVKRRKAKGHTHKNKHKR